MKKLLSILLVCASFVSCKSAKENQKSSSDYFFDGKNMVFTQGNLLYTVERYEKPSIHPIGIYNLHKCDNKCLADISVEWNPRIEGNLLVVDWKIDFNGHDPFVFNITYWNKRGKFEPGDGRPLVNENRQTGFSLTGTRYAPLTEPGQWITVYLGACYLDETDDGSYAACTPNDNQDGAYVAYLKR